MIIDNDEVTFFMNMWEDNTIRSAVENIFNSNKGKIFQPLPLMERIKEGLNTVLDMQGLGHGPKKAKPGFTLTDLLNWYRDRHPDTYEPLDSE